MGNSRVFIISAGLLRPKKTDSKINRLNQYLNYGLVGLASILKRSGYDPVVLHGKFMTPDSILAKMIESGFTENNLPVLISIPSFLAVEWAAAFTSSIHSLAPHTSIVVGGRWVIGEDPAWIRGRVPHIDTVVVGEAEDHIIDLMDSSKWSELPITDRARSVEIIRYAGALPDLDYTVMPDWRDFHPSLEMSRGCGFGCTFCLERDVKLGKMRPAANAVASLQRYTSLYSSTIRPYFEASLFRPTEQWAHEFESQYRAEGLQIKWRCETRVDLMDHKLLKHLAAAGLRVVDLGFESASPQQLTSMGKSKKPAEYIRKASDILRSCHDLGIWPKVNVLLYAGETVSTISETVDWLEDHRRFVKGVSVNPLLVYRFNREANAYLSSLQQFGATPVNPLDLEGRGFSEMHLSKSIDAQGAMEWSLRISRMFMTISDYFDLKSFSYYNRNLTFEEFRSLATSTDKAELPFTMPRGDHSAGTQPSLPTIPHAA